MRTFQTREALVTSKDEELSGLKERTEELEEACAKANALVRNLEQRMRDKDDEILALMQQVAARRVDAGQGDATGPGDVPFASDGDVVLEAENDAVGEGVAEGIVEPSGEQNGQDQAQGNGETVVVVAALEQEMARLREEMGKCQAVCVSQKTRIDDLQSLLDESEHQRVALQLSLDSTHVLQVSPSSPAHVSFLPCPPHLSPFLAPLSAHLMMNSAPRCHAGKVGARPLDQSAADPGAGAAGRRYSEPDAPCPGPGRRR